MKKKLITVLITVLICLTLTVLILHVIRNKHRSKLFATDDINVITIRFKTDKVVLSDKAKEELLNKFNDSDYKLNGKNASKGWVYEIVFTHSDGKTDTIYILSDKQISYEGNIYSSLGLTLDFLDHISGIHRQ